MSETKGFSESVASLCRRYFEEFLPKKKDAHFIKNLTSLDAVFAINISDASESSWTIVIKSGELKDVCKQFPGEASFTYNLTADTFLSIVCGKLNPQMAFFTGKVKISGDMIAALKVSTVLEPFFKENPFPCSSS